MKAQAKVEDLRIAEVPLAEQLANAEAESSRNFERVEEAEAALLREYHYHMLRAEELREFLHERGHGFGDD